MLFSVLATASLIAATYRSRRLTRIPLTQVTTPATKLSINSLMKAAKRMNVAPLSPNLQHEQAFVALRTTLERLNLFDEKQSKIYMSAVKYASFLCPDASLEDLTTYSLFQWFTLSFDDLLEKDKAFSNAQKRNELIDACLDIFRSGSTSLTIPEDIPNAKSFVNYFKELRDRVTESMGEYSSVWIPRFATTVEEWLYKGSVPAIDYLHDQSHHSSKEVLQIRRYDINILQIFDLQELVQRLEIPDEIYSHVECVEMRMAQADAIALMNDLLSYGKEKKEEYPFNYVISLEKEHHSTVEAATIALNLLHQRVDDFLGAESRLIEHIKGRFDDKVTKDVAKYIQGMKVILQTAIGFSLKSGRYNHPLSLFQELVTQP